MDINYICKVANNEFSKRGRSEKFEELETLVYQKCSYAEILKYVQTVKGADIDQACERIIAYNDAEFAYYFACDCKKLDKINTQKLQKAVLDMNDPHYAYEFARDVKFADIQSIENYIINSGIKTQSTHYIKKFLKIRGCNKAKLLEAIDKIHDKQLQGVIDELADSQTPNTL